MLPNKSLFAITTSIRLQSDIDGAARLVGQRGIAAEVRMGGQLFGQGDHLPLAPLWQFDMSPSDLKQVPAPLCVAACNHRGVGPQSSRFLAQIN